MKFFQKDRFSKFFTKQEFESEFEFEYSTFFNTGLYSLYNVFEMLFDMKFSKTIHR